MASAACLGPRLLDSEVHSREELDVEDRIDQIGQAFVLVQSGGGARGDEDCDPVAFFCARSFPSSLPMRRRYGLRRFVPPPKKLTLFDHEPLAGDRVCDHEA